MISVRCCAHIVQLKKLQLNKKGVVINPGTPVETILPVLSNVDYVLVMTVNPGFGGQSFIEQCINKLNNLINLNMRII